MWLARKFLAGQGRQEKLRTFVKDVVTIVMVVMICGAAAGGQQVPAASGSSSQPLTRPVGGLLFVGSQDSEPFSFLNSEGRPSGFDVDVIQAVGQRLGVPVAVQLLPLPEALAAARDGRADGIIGMGVLPDQPDPSTSWKLCGPTVQRVYRIFVSANSRRMKDGSGLRDLAGTRVAVLAEDPVAAFLGNERTLGLESVRRSRDACNYVASGRYAAFIADENVIRYGARQISETRGRFVGPPVYEIKQWGPAVPLPVDANGVATGDEVIGLQD